VFCFVQAAKPVGLEIELPFCREIAVEKTKFSLFDRLLGSASSERGHQKKPKQDQAIDS
jgi:hypothetical protein